MRPPPPSGRGTTRPPVVVIGLGNDFRRDDGVGPHVARLVARRARSIPTAALDGEAARLVEAWRDATLAVVVDAVQADDEAGSVHRLDASAALGPTTRAPDSSHGLGLTEALELGRVVGRLPGRLVVYGVVGADFDQGPGLSPAVEAAATGLADRIVAEIAAVDVR